MHTQKAIYSDIMLCPGCAACEPTPDDAAADEAARRAEAWYAAEEAEAAYEDTPAVEHDVF